MRYPNDFVNRCKRAFPNSELMHKALDNGSTFVGRYLDDSSDGVGVTTDEILAATDLEQLKAKVRLHLEKRRLYDEWTILYDRR